MSLKEQSMAAVKKPVEPLKEETLNLLEKTANTIRQLAMDATQKANSGHPGLPMGCAEIGAYLYGHCLRHNPKDSKWLNRDRFILSAGHGSLLLYSCLHLSGFNLSLEEIKNFRQLHSETPGHPEKRDTDGVETTTGPLGQGVGNAVGQALGLKLLAERFNSEKQKIFDSKVFCLAGDGCIMEGVTSEASSLAGHLQLNNLILIYDANQTSLDGPLSDSCSEDTKTRYRSYGWDVYEVDGHDLENLHQVISEIRETQERPCFILAHTIIGKGAPNKAGTHKAHGSPLGEEEVKLTKEALGLSEEEFFIPRAVTEYFDEKIKKDVRQQDEWERTLKDWGAEHPEKMKVFQRMAEKKIPGDLEEKLKKIEIKSPLAGRKVSHALIQELAKELPFLYGGSADLSCSDNTMLDEMPIIRPGIFTGRNLKFGVREFAMSTSAIGMEQTQMIIPFVGSFLTFSDYMRNSIRLAALQKSHVIYQLTHDSVFLGEDGPTHQPVEHYAALRAVPNLYFFRPGDHHEVRGAWISALHYDGPSIIALSRQNLPRLEETDVPCKEGVGKGAYILRKEKKENPDFTLFATGSELHLAVDAADELEKLGHQVRVVSMPCWKLFEQQEEGYKDSVVGGDLGVRVAIEAGVELGWHKYIGRDGIMIGMESFGLSAPLDDLQKEFGFTVDDVIERILAK